MRGRLRRKMSGQRVKEITENAQDITKPKPSPTKDFSQARGLEPEPAAEKTTKRIKDTYRAFLDMVDEVTKKPGRGAGREINKKPPKAPEFR